MTERPRRIVVTGGPGSGKSWLASKLATGLQVPYVELDARYHGPGWVPADPQVFIGEVRAIADGPAWMIDGNYSVVRDIVRARAQLIVALDLSRPVVFSQLVCRTLRRMLTKEELWNGNRERWRNLVSADQERNLLLWAYLNFGKYRDRARADERASRAGGARAVRLTSRGQIDRFVVYLTDSADPTGSADPTV